MRRGPKLIQLPKNEESRGYLTYIEKHLHIPFAIEETNLFYNIPKSKDGFITKLDGQDEFIIPLSGSFEIKIKGASLEETFFLNKAYEGLFVPAGMIRTIFNISPKVVILKLKSKKTQKINTKIQDK